MSVEHDFVKYALTHYNVPLYSEEDFFHDLNKIVVLKKLFRRYTTTGVINERLVLNNIIILLNVFGIEATNKMLFHRVKREHWAIVKTFLIFLDSYKEEDETSELAFDEDIAAILGEIRWHSRLHS